MTADLPDLVELTRAECLALLRTATTARVGFVDDGVPQVLPVTYAVFDGAVLFRTAAGSALVGAAADAVVAVEVDDLEPALRIGWSVVVHGRASVHPLVAAPTGDPAGHLAQDPAAGPRPWAEGTRNVLVRVPLDVVRGRRIPVHRLPARGATGR